MEKNPHQIKFSQDFFTYRYYDKTEVVCEAVKHSLGLDEFSFTSICFCQIFETIGL